MECGNEACRRAVSQPRYCPSCKKAVYCSQQCRLDHWYAGHQLSCGIEADSAPSPFQLSDFSFSASKSTILGKGAYGEVRLVTHSSSQQRYALKVVNKSQFQRENSLHVMRREILLHRELDHPNIIKLHGHLEDTENVYLVLELADRGSLFHEIRRVRKLSEDKARGYFRQVCEAVQYLHEHEIIHRDIKPENILLDKTGSIKLCDFGWCAKGTETRTTFCGTLDYMAPEMVMGGGHTFSIDLWALGVLLYELVHGSAPFTARKEADKCRQILGSLYTVDPSLSPALHALIACLLQPRPEDRLAVSQVLAHEWVQKGGEVVQIGSVLKSYVKGYGIAEGQVTAIEGDYCTVYFQAPDVTEQISVSRACKILKRKPIKVPDPPSSSSIQEAALLDQIEEWCKAPPSRPPAKPDKFLALLEQSNKQLEESLQRLNKAKGTGLEADEEGLKVEIEKVDAVMLTTFDEPETTPGQTLTSPDVFPESELRDTAKESFTPKTFRRPDLTIDPELVESSHGTSSFSPLDSTPGLGEDFDFEAERQKIEERNQQFYCLSEEKWAERNSNDSLVKAPRLRARDPHLESSSTQLLQELDQLTLQTKRSPESPRNMQVLVHANAALQARKAQLESLLIEMEKPLPRVHKPIDHKAVEKNGFLRWIGSMIGCGDRV